MAEAIDHALAAHDFERAADLIEQLAWPVLARGELATVSGWITSLPDDLRRSRPRLAFFNSWGFSAQRRGGGGRGIAGRG